MIAFQFVIVTLATYRIARMIADERGPEDAFDKLRTEVYRRWPDVVVSQTHSTTGELISVTRSSWQFDGITCVDCLSFWLAWVTALALPLYGVDYVIGALAVSAVCVLINHNSK